MKAISVLEKIEAGIKESNSEVVQELIANFEKYGLSPVLSIEGKLKNNFKLIQESELKNFTKEVKKFGFQKSDFCLFGKDKDNTLSKLSSGIIVIHKKSGKIKEYKTNSSSTWTANFHQDLKNKFFIN